MPEGDYVDGVVSLWVGQADSFTSLAAYADYDHPQPPSVTLSRDFGTGRYDHDFMDMAVEKSTRSLSELLRGCSYDSIIIPKFVNLRGDLLPEAANAFVLLYNFQHNGNSGPGVDSGSPVRLRYMGSIKVDMPWPD
jgi:Immunity protein 22